MKVSRFVMAGLVPAIHVLQNSSMAGGYVYVLTNRPNGILYIGVTNDLVHRVFEHRSGFIEGFTKRYGLKRLVYFEKFDDSELENLNRTAVGLSRPSTWMAGTSPAMTNKGGAST